MGRQDEMNYQVEHEQFIEYLGQLTEAEGMPRIAARIFGLLLLSPRELSLDEIAEQLAVSRASVSTDARRLEGCGFLERVTRRGDRRDYYRLASDYFVQAMERKAASIDRFAVVLAAGAELPGLDPTVQERMSIYAQLFRMSADRLTQDIERIRQRFPGFSVVSSPKSTAELLACGLKLGPLKPTTSADKDRKSSSRVTARSSKRNGRGAPKSKKS
jgi:DNA-binding transcriptional regulator GbsR (MarR family)